ncbi:hypothetical protein TNCV_2306721 [Trichonephila clavipes]|nr:hypothetical protein TNCV_2306721 [Trichonephila clavipes]
MKISLKTYFHSYETIEHTRPHKSEAGLDKPSEDRLNCGVLPNSKNNMKFERGRIIGEIEAGWSAWRVARQLGHSDCVVRRYWDQWIREMSFTRRPAPDALDRPVVEKTPTS